MKTSKARLPRVLLSLLASATIGLLLARATETSPCQLSSPDGRIVVTVSTQGPLSYRVEVDGTPVIAPSHLGLRLVENVELGRNVALDRVARTEADSTWTNPLGKRRAVRDLHRELKLDLSEQSAGGRKFSVIFRAFDDGIGFRYALPADATHRDIQIEEDLAEFTFPTDNVSFAGDHIEYPPEEYNARGGFAGSQEWEFRRRHLSELPMDTVTGLPVVAQSASVWIAIMESDLVDWAALWLARAPQKTDSTAVTLRARLAPRLDGHGAVKATLPHDSPWRVLIIGREPGRLVESDLVLNLSTPSRIADPAWVKPGMMAWDRWWSGMGKVDTATMKEFITFAGEMGWPYQLVDGGWYKARRTTGSDITQPVPEIDLPELRRFAAEHGVRLWLWLYWTDVDHADLEKAFSTYEKWGIAGLKIDFMDRDDQEMVNWYERITTIAARHHLMVNFHGAYKPTGMIRTWPNQITREGILGNEYNKWSHRVTAEHRVTLPFTRFLAGPGDFTPGGFLNRQPGQHQLHVTPTQVQGTRAGQLALFVCYDSPITCVSDHPDHLRGQAGIDFLKLVPTVWDETKVLSGVIGEHLVMARRAGEQWFVGALNNDHTRVCDTSLAFLGTGNWKVRWWHDARNSDTQAENLEVEERTVQSSDMLPLRLSPGGGAVLHFVRIP